MLTPLSPSGRHSCLVDRLLVRCAGLLAYGWLLACAASVAGAELPPSVGAAAGQQATVRPLLPPGPLGPLTDFEAGPQAPLVPGSPPGRLGGPAVALAHPPGTLMGPENSVPPLASCLTGHDSAAGCGCAHCAAGGGGPHVYATANTPPTYAPSQGDLDENAWLPQIEEDWFGRPAYGGAYAGMLVGDEIIASRLKFEPGLLTGVRIGQDCDRRWAWESHVAYGAAEVSNLQGPEQQRDGDVFLGDTNLVYSRHATKRLRPYVSAGMGVGYFDLTDEQGGALREIVPTVPLGAGLQYRLDEWLVLSLDVRDYLTLGQQADWETMHNLAVAGGLEFRFGVSPNVYYPWTARAQSPR